MDSYSILQSQVRYHLWSLLLSGVSVTRLVPTVQQGAHLTHVPIPSALHLVVAQLMLNVKTSHGKGDKNGDCVLYFTAVYPARSIILSLIGAKIIFIPWIN